MADILLPTRKQRLMIQTLFWGVFVALFVWIAYNNIVPTGKMTVSYTVPTGSRQFDKFSSDDDSRLIGTTASSDKTAYLHVAQPPLSFSVYAPRSFTKATVRLTYQNPNGQSVLRLGIQQAGPGFLYRDMVVDDPTLDALPAWWQKVTDGSKTLWERNADYQQKVQQSDAQKALRQKAIEKKFQQDTLILTKDEAKHAISEDAFHEKMGALTAQHDQDLAALGDQYKVSAQEMGKPIFATVADFLASTPDPKKTLLYNTTLPPLHLANYTPATANAVITTSLRGSHQIVTYIGKDETLSFTLSLQDINRHGGIDSFSVSVSDVNRTVISKKIALVGSGNATGIPSVEQTLHVEKTGLPEGVYTINMQTTDDVFIKHIETSQRYIMFAKSVYLADNAEYQDVLGTGPFSAATVYTDGTMLSVLTAHTAGLQTLLVGSSHLSVNKIQKSFPATLGEKITTLTTPRNDVKLTGNGNFAFSNSQMFDPPRYAEYSPGMDLTGCDFILADYPQPQQHGDWLVAQTTMTNEVYTNKDHVVRFAIAMPGLADNHRAMNIRSVQVIFEKHPLTPRYLWSKLTQKLTTLFHK